MNFLSEELKNVLTNVETLTNRLNTVQSESRPPPPPVVDSTPYNYDFSTTSPSSPPKLLSSMHQQMPQVVDDSFSTIPASSLPPSNSYTNSSSPPLQHTSSRYDLDPVVQVDEPAPSSLSTNYENFVVESSPPPPISSYPLSTSITTVTDLPMAESVVTSGKMEYKFVEIHSHLHPHPFH